MQPLKQHLLKFFTIVSLLCVLNGGFIAPVSAQCAMCKGSAEDAAADEDQKVATSLNDAILYLLAMPYLAAGTVGFLYYYNTRVKKP